MPIEGTSLGDVTVKFQEHLNRLLAKTVTQTRLVAVSKRQPPAMQIAFRQRGFPSSSPLRTQWGPAKLFLGQTCASRETDNGKHRLETLTYRYTLTFGDDREPLFRWEYIRRWPTPEDRWCRHHLQGPVPIPRLGNELLNSLHLPTGYVTIEDVLRFCIHDLGVPPLDDEWHTHLEASYRMFRTEFVPGPEAVD